MSSGGLSSKSSVSKTPDKSNGKSAKAQAAHGKKPGNGKR
jgi:hypothetical protein